MKINSWACYILFFLIFLQITVIQAQKIEKKYDFEWTDNLFQSISEDEKREFLHFQDAAYLREYPSLPALCERFSVDQDFQEYDISFSDVQFEPLSAHDCALIPAQFIASNLTAKAVTVKERGKTYVLLTIVPFVRSGEQQVNRLKSVRISLQGKQPRMTKSTRSYASSSILATGSWYNFSIAETGIHQVTYSDLVNMGVPTPIQSAHLALFGNGGEMLPEANDQPRPDDLLELPIFVFDGGDGSFDSGDYFLFYGHSPHTERYDAENQCFTHNTNIYSDSSWYFVTTTPGVGQKKRIQTVNNAQLNANFTTNEMTYFAFVEEDLYNLGETGKDWLGDNFDINTSKTYTFTTPSAPTGQGKVTLRVAGLSGISSYFRIDVNGISVGNVSLSPINSSYLARFGKGSFAFNASSSQIPVTLTYSKPNTSSSAYLDWLEVQIPCRLSMTGGQVSFCDPNTVGTGRISQFDIANAVSGMRVWDITEPSECVQYTLTIAGGVASFKVATDTLRKFIAFDGSNYLKVSPGAHVNNQNLHATGAVDLVIVTHSKFAGQVQKLADFRQSNDGLKVKIVTIDQVYNEFSGGSQDPMAIRDYMKMIYDKTDCQYPKYLLLVGRPSYDFRGRKVGTEIFVPNYQYAANEDGITEYDFYANDDTFGLLDDGEGANGSGMYDLAIGRFPVSTVAQVNAAVEKSILYTTNKNLVSQNSTDISNLGDWRNVMAFVADDEDWNDFIINADHFTELVADRNSNINFDKIYLDAYQQVSNAGGQRYPEVTTAINNRMNRGALFFTYIGHSGKDGWAAERILENSDINRWHNKYNMPVMLTLSCTFGYYDRPALSPAELAFLNSEGGVSAIITTTREAWSSPNNSYGRNIFMEMFDRSSGDYPTIGEIEYRAKNRYGGSSTSLAMFVTMGDPSMRLAVPKYNVVTDSINHIAVDQPLDTLRALSKVTIAGHVADLSGHCLENFNGSIFPSVYDKKVTVSTLVNDPGSQPFSFETQKSVLFKGNCTVKDGHFNFSFYIPKDIDYSFGNGKISYYALSSQLQADAAGNFTEFVIGGTDTCGVEDNEGPQIRLFLNDENFVNGGITDPNPVLIAKIKDNYGINTTGNGIGHNLTAIVDDATDKQIVLNDYYQTEKDSFNMGTVKYNLEELTPGKHTLMVRAWDINNNHSEAELTFEVLSEEKLELSHVLNYPNPFTTHTDFFFEHNQPGGLFDVQIQIYTISGKLVKTINRVQNIEGTRSQAISWDGRDDFGDKIGKGVYLYRLRVRNQNNEIAEKLEKIVIL